MNILITGGAGFIGSHLAKKLIDAGHKVYIADDLSTGSFSNILPSANFIKCDLSKKTSISKLPLEVDVIYHLASQASGQVSCEMPEKDLRINAGATLLLLRWAKSNGVKKFIFTSTMGVYKDQTGIAAMENSIVAPKSFYGINKLTSEAYIKIYAEEGMRTTIFRLFNVYGPGQNMDNLKQGIISIYMYYVINKLPILIRGPLNRIRDFVYIDDVVDALYLGLDKRSDGGLFNVCTNKPTSVEEVLGQIFQTFDLSPDYPLNIEKRTPRDIDAIWGDYSHIYTILGWSPKNSISVGIQKMADWLVRGRSV
jgi:UDP-glucose 4-epimerase